MERETVGGVSRYSVFGSKFELDARYDVVEPIGQGAYGVVVAAKDTKTGDMVAVKKIENPFHHATFTVRTLREITILRLLKHENIIGLRKLCSPINIKDFDDLYCIFDLMETDLASIIKSPQPLTDEHCQFFLYQILRGLKFIHSAGVIHRDLKPRNILVNSNCDLKICDFGLARCDFGLDDQSDKAKGGLGSAESMTDYVATRWYRPPEIILSWKAYSKAIDMWGVGCIFAELLGRKPLFPGSDSREQIKLIIQVLGPPNKEELDEITEEKAYSYVKSYCAKCPKPVITIKQKFRGYPRLAVKLLCQLLVFHPDFRLNVEDAISHNYFEQLHCPDDEPSSERLSADDFAWEFNRVESKSVLCLRERIIDEVCLYNPGQEKKRKRVSLPKGAAVRSPLSTAASDLRRALPNGSNGNSPRQTQQRGPVNGADDRAGDQSREH